MCLNIHHAPWLFCPTSQMVFMYVIIFSNIVAGITDEKLDETV